MVSELEHMSALQQAWLEHVMAVRREYAEKMRGLAVQCEFQTLSVVDAQEKAWLEGMSEGLRTAAAEIDPEPRASVPQR